MIKVESFGIVPFVNEKGTWKVLLILHREGNHWGFPKGKANPNETPLESATRELLEETGLKVASVLRKDPLTEQYQFRRKKQFIVKTVQYFPALVEGDLNLQEEEIREAKWVTISEALQQLTFREARHILQEFIRTLNLQKS
ncbi:MAG: NUDIX domain-containing protein [Verrucomicrobia bacterium]|nr:NUDIX domain-containing protein [Verrucomicrobiota bacterium]